MPPARGGKHATWVAEPIVDVFDRSVNENEDAIRNGPVLLADLRDLLAPGICRSLLNIANVAIVGLVFRHLTKGKLSERPLLLRVVVAFILSAVPSYSFHGGIATLAPSVDVWIDQQLLFEVADPFQDGLAAIIYVLKLFVCSQGILYSANHLFYSTIEVVISNAFIDGKLLFDIEIWPSRLVR